MMSRNLIRETLEKSDSFIMGMFIYSISNADISKKYKIRFFSIFFSQYFKNLKITENMCDHIVVTPPYFFRKISYIIG